MQAASLVADKSLANEYRQALREQFFESRRKPPHARPNHRDARPDRRQGRPFTAADTRIPKAKLHLDGTTRERLRNLTAILLRHPFLLADVAQAYGALEVDPPLLSLRNAIIEWGQSAETLDSVELMDHLTKSGFEQDVQHVLAASPMPLPTCASSDAMPAEAESGWWHIFGFLNEELLREEVALAEAEAARNLTPETWHRQKALVEALAKIRSGEPDGPGLIDA
jgi:DNA primase